MHDSLSMCSGLICSCNLYGNAMCQNTNNKTTAVNKECRHKFSIHTDQEGSDTYLQLSGGFSPAVKIRFIQKGQIMGYTNFPLLHLHGQSFTSYDVASSQEIMWSQSMKQKFSAHYVCMHYI